MKISKKKGGKEKKKGDSFFLLLRGGGGREGKKKKLSRKLRVRGGVDGRELHLILLSAGGEGGVLLRIERKKVHYWGERGIYLLIAKGERYSVSSLPFL